MIHLGGAHLSITERACTRRDPVIARAAADPDNRRVGPGSPACGIDSLIPDRVDNTPICYYDINGRKFGRCATLPSHDRRIRETNWVGFSIEEPFHEYQQGPSTIEDFAERGEAAPAAHSPSIFIDGGVEAEHCLARNQAAFSPVTGPACRAIFVDVSKRSSKTTPVRQDLLTTRSAICPNRRSPALWAHRRRPHAGGLPAGGPRTSPSIMSCAANEAIEGCRETGAAATCGFQALHLCATVRSGMRIVETGPAISASRRLVITAGRSGGGPSASANLRNGFTRPLRWKLSTIIDGP